MHSLDDSPASYLILLPSPSLNTVELIVIYNRPCELILKLQYNCLCDSHPVAVLMFDITGTQCTTPKGMKARVSPMLSIEPHRILAPTRDSNQEPPGPGPQSKVVTTILPRHTILPLPTLFDINPQFNTSTAIPQISMHKPSCHNFCPASESHH